MSDLVLDREDGLGIIRLERPQALNALTMDMIGGLSAALVEWAADPSVTAVVIEGAGDRAFCAGGDVRALYDARNDPASTYRADFYREEYRLNRAIFRFPKPYVAVMDGITMAGGVGVSVHGSHQVVTERTLFAMPETGIGLFPDVGGGHFLPRCPGAVGMYMGLTGARLKAADCLHAGIATHYVASADLGAITGGGDPVAALDGLAGDPGPSALATARDDIDRVFGRESVAEIIAALEADDGEWAAKTLATLRAKAPLSLCVSFRQLCEGRDLDFEPVMVMEYRLSQRFMIDHDFFEGVRAIIIDKDNAPRWRHGAVGDVTAAEVDAYFAPLGPDDLNFE